MEGSMAALVSPMSALSLESPVLKASSAIDEGSPTDPTDVGFTKLKHECIDAKLLETVNALPVDHPLHAVRDRFFALNEVMEEVLDMELLARIDEALFQVLINEDADDEYPDDEDYMTVEVQRKYIVGMRNLMRTLESALENIREINSVVIG